MISYGDSEVRKFHPLCERALEYALRANGDDVNYKVAHHKYTGALEMDFVIENVTTGKYLCVIEVKRTMSDVNSTRYQYQAMSYVQMNSGITEKPFYILTNLESAIAFRYDASKPKVFQQMLVPGMVNIGEFSSFITEEELVNALGNYFKDMLADFKADRYDYFLTLGNFAEAVYQVKNNQKLWKSSMAIMMYEYIRRAFNQVNRGSELHDIRLFHNNIKQICDEAASIDFKGIFEYSAALFEPTVAVSNDLLSELFEYGRENITGDSIAEVIHQIVSEGNEHDGEVPTDLELARLAAILAHDVSGSIRNGEYICDPAAGSGNLISSAIEPYNLKSYQIKANDCNIQLLELLSLRLGLNYAGKICKADAPEITCSDITDLSAAYFEGVRVIIMNPPFVAGINCVSRKKAFFDRIKELSGEEALTKVGHMPLEAVFLELICELVPKGTVIVCVFPKTHLTARGEEAKLIRQLLLEKCGLNTIFAYPGEGIFENVVKDTCVIVGKVKQVCEEIRVISSSEEIRNIDIARFGTSIKKIRDKSFVEIMPGISGRIIERKILLESKDNGWRELNIDIIDAIRYVSSYLENCPKLKQLKEYGYLIKRGMAANGGGSNLMFWDSKKELYDVYKDKVVFGIGMRNAKTIDTLDIGDGDSQFLDISLNHDNLIDDIIRAYMKTIKISNKQSRDLKTLSEWKNILRKESKNVFPVYSVLIPRAIRTDGRAFLSTEKVFVSTNFVVWTLPEYEKALVAATWMTTIFYQLICEVLAKDQEGMRKMEVADIMLTLVPDFVNVSKDTVLKLKKEKDNIKFLKLNDPIIRETDKIWARELFASDADKRLEEAARLLQCLANRRNR